MVHRHSLKFWEDVIERATMSSIVFRLQKDILSQSQ
jgi:hypothetical protein